MLMLTFTQLIAGGLDSKKGGMPPLGRAAYRFFFWGFSKEDKPPLAQDL